MAHICTMVPVALSIGSNRIVPAAAVTSPVGDAGLDSEAELALRRELAERALAAVQAAVEGPTVLARV